MNISQKINSIQPSGIREFFELVLGMDDVISLGVGEPDFVTPWRIRETGIHSLERGYTSYTSNKGLKELRELIAKKIKKEHSTPMDPEKEVLITTGVSEAYDLAIRSLINQGDEVITINPSYVSYNPCIKLAGGKPQRIKTRLENNFKPSPQKIKEKINTKTKAIVLNYPNNPTGANLNKKELKEIAEIAKENDLVIISDEIYDEITYKKTKTSILDIKDIKENVVLLNGFSKSYAMTGWRIGYAAGKQEVIEAMNKIHQYTMLCAPIISQKAAIEAIKNTKKELQHMIEKYQRRRKFTTNKLTEIGLPHLKPRGSFYVFPKIDKTNLSSEEFAKKLLKEQKIAVVPGTAFGESGEKHVRISFATSQEKLKTSLSRINEFVKNQT